MGQRSPLAFFFARRKLDWKFPVGAGSLVNAGGPSHFWPCMLRPHGAADIPLDPSSLLNDVSSLATGKRVQPAKTVPTKGAVLAAKYRARANGLYDEERRRHRAHAMSLIYNS